MKKIAIGASVLVLLSVWVFVGLNNNTTTLDNASANPDYICKKAQTEQPCRLSNYPASCSEWDASGNRTCPWMETTEVSYYLIRTNCESGYTKVSNWGNVWGSSWRHGWNYVSGEVSCNIIESDHVAPTWKVD